MSKDYERSTESIAALVLLSMVHLMLRRLTNGRRKRSQRFRYPKAK